MKRVSPLVVLLPIQALLLFWNLDLLPIWTDELFTYSVVRKPLEQIVPVLQRDIHPPLYYFLLHGLSLAGLSSLAAMRAFSGLWALLCTVILDVCWTRRWKPERRWLAVSLLALSPCLLLYGRMARSYSMQAALSLFAVWAMWRWIKKPGSLRAASLASGALLAVLYTHYVPGLALAVAFAVTAWRRIGLKRMAAFSAVVFCGYLPWMLTLETALKKWGAASGFSSQYMISGNPVAEHIVKLGYGLVSLSIGENFHFIGLFVAPLVLLLVFVGTRSTRLTPMIVVAALLGYAAVSRWVSYPFIPARLLWLLPFGAMAIACARPRRVLAGIVLVCYATSIGFYFAKEHYLNKGYMAPVREIADDINRHARAQDLVLIDAYNTDDAALRFYLKTPASSIVLTPDQVETAHSRVATARYIWIVRNARDVSPGRIWSALETEACAGRARHMNSFFAYEPWHKLTLQILGVAPPESFYESVTCQLID